jgi:murein DD-endopeptidase MepM/ murein hydrolase activator NlpD
VHVVAPGENLTGIASRANTTVAEVLRLNHLPNANHVEIGQRLLVPGAAPRMLCPVAGFHTAVDGFGDPRPGGKRHDGDDIFAPRGVPVVANVAGQLSHVTGAVTGNGYYLRGDDGVTYYGAHLDGYVAPPGRVAAGTVIGRVGNTGDAATTPTHLHFEIKPGGGAPVDPWPVLSRIC